MTRRTTLLLAALPVTESLETVESQVFKLVNEARQRAALPALTLAEPMAEEARKHSRQMAEKKVVFGHGGFADRRQRLSQKIPVQSFAENVGQNAKGAESVVEMWLASGGHAENIMSKQYKQTGVGAWRDARGYSFFTQIFAG